jgi:hypothetical protein
MPFGMREEGMDKIGGNGGELSKKKGFVHIFVGEKGRNIWKRKENSVILQRFFKTEI